MKRSNPPCAAPPLSSFPMGKKLDTTQRGAAQGGFLLFILFTRRFSGLGGLTPKKLRKAILFVTIILVFSKMGNILTIRIIGEQLTIPMLEQDG